MKPVATQTTSGPVTKAVKHQCRKPDYCMCHPLALEPAEDCPVHGHPWLPVNCMVCGKFMKQKLFSVTKDDFVWQFFRGTGSGGQKKNKTSSACRCIHEESGAVGESQEARSQLQNRQIAFRKCVETPKFQSWLKLKTSATLKGFSDIERMVDDMMRPENIKEETF